jgi:hypothetical protein
VHLLKRHSTPVRTHCHADVCESGITYLVLTYVKFLIRLFQVVGGIVPKPEKLKCLLHYFRRVCTRGKYTVKYFSLFATYNFLILLMQFYKACKISVAQLYFTKYSAFKILKLNFMHSYQTPGCSAMSEELTNTTIWCDVVGSSFFLRR